MPCPKGALEKTRPSGKICRFPGRRCKAQPLQRLLSVSSAGLSPDCFQRGPALLRFLLDRPVEKAYHGIVLRTLSRETAASTAPSVRAGSADSFRAFLPQKPFAGCSPDFASACLSNPAVSYTHLRGGDSGSGAVREASSGASLELSLIHICPVFLPFARGEADGAFSARPFLQPFCL